MAARARDMSQQSPRPKRSEASVTKLHLFPEERQLIKQRASEYGMTMTGFLRECALGKVSPVVRSAEADAAIQGLRKDIVRIGVNANQEARALNRIARKVESATMSSRLRETLEKLEEDIARETEAVDGMLAAIDRIDRNYDAAAYASGWEAFEHADN